MQKIFAEICLSQLWFLTSPCRGSSCRPPLGTRTVPDRPAGQDCPPPPFFCPPAHTFLSGDRALQWKKLLITANNQPVEIWDSSGSFSIYTATITNINPINQRETPVSFSLCWLFYNEIYTNSLGFFLFLHFPVAKMSILSLSINLNLFPCR